MPHADSFLAGCRRILRESRDAWRARSHGARACAELCPRRSEDHDALPDRPERGAAGSCGGQGGVERMGRWSPRTGTLASLMGCGFPERLPEQPPKARQSKARGWSKWPRSGAAGPARKQGWRRRRQQPPRRPGRGSAFGPAPTQAQSSKPDPSPLGVALQMRSRGEAPAEPSRGSLESLRRSDRPLRGPAPGTCGAPSWPPSCWRRRGPRLRGASPGRPPDGRASESGRSARAGRGRAP